MNIYCANCEHECSEAAQACPACGHPLRREGRRWLAVPAILLTATLCAILVVKARDTRPLPHPEESSLRHDAAAFPPDDSLIRPGEPVAVTLLPLTPELPAPSEEKPEGGPIARHVARADEMRTVAESLQVPCPDVDVRCRTYHVALINGMPIICGHPQVRRMTQAFAAKLADEPLYEWLDVCLQSLEHRSPWHIYRRMQDDWYNRDHDYYRPDDLQIYEAIYNVARDEKQKALALDRFNELAMQRWTESVNHTVRGLFDPDVVRHAHPQPLAKMPRWDEP